MKSRNEIDALVSLLDDPDEIIFNQIKSQLLELGTDCISVPLWCARPGPFANANCTRYIC